ncbi:hypothetical protein B0E38_06470 [Streptomyces sp. 111WW2]|uniref:hypothetical protein n=1 Tax=Streptomyces sp. 111WW2 TaxID=1945515 RepID=UPI000D0C763F|nr:hypothetical protein [Streptomyces sp. 111WW2]PSK47993.1 hypothetical protein B0E38_06470 [Streptomyces sp. 111WW2]
MAHGIEPSSTNVPQPYGTPDASIVVFAEDNGWRRPAVLSTLTDGTRVYAAGTVHEAREHGTIDSPRITFQLINALDQATYAAGDSEALALYGMCLMDGVKVAIRGVVRRPFEGDTELDDPRANYVQVTSVEPLFG